MKPIQYTCLTDQRRQIVIYKDIGMGNLYQIYRIEAQQIRRIFAKQMGSQSQIAAKKIKFSSKLR